MGHSRSPHRSFAWPCHAQAGRGQKAVGADRGSPRAAGWGQRPQRPPPPPHNSRLRAGWWRTPELPKASWRGGGACGVVAGTEGEMGALGDRLPARKSAYPPDHPVSPPHGPQSRPVDGKLCPSPPLRPVSRGRERAAGRLGGRACKGERSGWCRELPNSAFNTALQRDVKNGWRSGRGGWSGAVALLECPTMT